MERSEPVRAASRDDLERAVELLAAGRRAPHRPRVGAPGVRRAEWELPGFASGRDNWVAGETGYAAVHPSGRLVLTASDERTADALLARPVERARERGLASLELRSPAESALVRRHPFQLRTEILALGRPLGGAEPEASGGPRSGCAPTRSATPRPCTRCSTTRIVAGTRATCRWRTGTGSER